MTAMRLKRYPSPSGGFALGKMGVGATMLKQGKTAKDYVQDGLVAMWDGIENAGWGVHDASATTWKDLIGNCSFTSSQNPSWDSDGFILTGSSSISVPFTDVSSEPAIALFSNVTTGGSLTVEIGMDFENTETSGLVFAGTLSGRWANFSFATPNMNMASLLASMSNGSANGQNSFGTGLGTYSMTSVYTKKSNGGFYAVSYTNGSQHSTGSLDSYVGSSRAAVGFGYAYSSYLRPKGKVRYSRIYSRALTAAEIAANYAIDKERFNLP